MNKTIKDLLILASFTVLVTSLVWLPHLLKIPNFWGLNFSNGFNTIYRNFDGLEYITIAKSFYSKQPIYFASHFPGYSILISLLAPFLGSLKSMLFVSLSSTILAVWAFYLLVKNFKLTSHPLFLSFLFILLPARWLVVHSVGSSEPTFIFFTTMAVYFFMKFELHKKYSALLLTALFGSLAQLTRPPGILLAIALALYIHWKAYLQSKTQGITKTWINHLRFLPLLLIPFTLIGIFYLYGQKYGDFWAYFHSGDNIHITFPPFGVFNKNQFWVGEAWLEDIVYIFILGFLGGITLWRRKLYPMSFFVLTYLIASTLVVHRDVSRYVLPITPFILIAFEKVLTSKEFKVVLPIILVVIYLYAQNFILQNVAPIPNLSIYN